MTERSADTEDLQVEYRGGCGADSYDISELIPSNMPNNSYYLIGDKKEEFPENPKDVIPDNKALRNYEIDKIIDDLKKVMAKFAGKAKQNIDKLVEITGESEDLVWYDIKLTESLTEERYFRGLLQLGNTDLAEYLEGWHETFGIEEKVVPLGRGININPGHNVAAVIIPEVWRALTKNSILHKMPSNDQFTLKLLNEAYQEINSPLADTFLVGYWPGGSNELEKNLFSADYVMAWGDDSTIKSIEEKKAPTTRSITFHFEFGAYLVDKETKKDYNDKDLMLNIAQDFSWGDQLLCFSPLIMAIEEDESDDKDKELTKKFLSSLSQALEEYHEDYELGMIPRNEKMKLMRAKRMAKNYGRLISDFENDTTVVLKDNLSKNDLNEFHNFRYVEAHTVNSLEKAVDIIGTSRNLQEFIMATTEENKNTLRDRITNTNANRIVAPGGAAPREPITWDGKHPLNEMVKWVTDEV